MKISHIKSKVEKLIILGNRTIVQVNESSEHDIEYATSIREFHSGSLSFLAKIFGEQHIFYETFVDTTNIVYYEMSLRQGIGILQAAKSEIDDGWLVSLKGIISIEIFNDFFEMAGHLLSEGYKDPAAVMIGSTLEEHLRNLCISNSIPLATPHPTKLGIDVPKKADVMNADLAKTQVYNLLDQKQVTAWLGLRNSAAHGKYNDYTKEQVETMQYGVMNFVARTT